MPVLPAWVRGLCLTAALVPGAALVVTLLRLRALCALYRDGRIFTLANVVCFRSLSRALLAWAIASIVYTPLHGLAVTAANPPGRHILTLGIGGTEVALLFVAVLAVVIARVMQMVAVDVTGLTEVAPGDVIHLLGGEGPEAITANDVAEWWGTIPYEVFCLFGLNPREYVREDGE